MTFAEQFTAERLELTADVLDYYRQMRLRYVRRYYAATFWVQRGDARRVALLYGKLKRQMENALT